MIVGSKRRRDEGDDALVDSVSTTIQKMARELDDVVGTVGRVNGTVLESVLGKIHQAEDLLTVSCESALKLWKLIVQSQRGRAASALSQIATAADAFRKGECIVALEQQLVSSTAAAAEEVSDGLNTASTAAVSLFSSQLKGEQEFNEQLLLRVREFFRQSLEAIQTYSRRALKAELLLSKKELAAVRLQSSLSFYQDASLRHHDEILALIKIVRLLAAKNKDVDIANSKLRQAKAHVKLLEKHLDLAEIVHAVVPPDFVPPREPTHPPNEALRRTAPEYFALRLLEHKDMTLSELVDSWQQQEARIVASEEKYRKLEISVEALRREALTVHHSFLEEKRRREVVEHRLVDLVRERIHPSGNDALVQQLTQLRDDYTKVLDDLAQVTTALGVTRETLAMEQQRSTMLEAKLQQMKDDAKLDEVANTLTSLRCHYEEEIERLKRGLVDADTQSGVAVLRAEAHQEATAEARNALITTEHTVMDISDALLRAEENVLAVQQQRSHMRLDHVVEDAQKALALSEAHLQNSMTSFEKVMLKAEAQQEKAMTSFEKQVTQLLESFQAILPTGSKMSQNTIDVDTAAVQQQQVRVMMRGVLAHALQFVSESLIKHEVAQSSLMDTSIANSQDVILLLEKVQTLTAERDAALERCDRCEQLIEQHSLTAVERVLMHEVSVEESLDAIEASEQILTLRKKLSSLEVVRSAAISEVKKLREELQQGECETQSRVARLELLERHNNRLSMSLEECLMREVSLVEQVHQLQRRLQKWSVCGRSVDPAGELEGMTTTEGRTQMMQQLEHLCDGISEVQEQLTRMRAEISAPDTNEDCEVEAQLLRKGVRQVANSLREAIRHAELFRHALPKEKVATGTVTVSKEMVENDNPEDEGAALCEPFATALNTHTSEMSARDEELARLRKEIESHTRIEVELRNKQEELQQQNADFQQKMGRLLQINKKLLEDLRAARVTTTSSTATTTTTEGASS